ncbi:uncharacterized protein LOC134260838 [Saccostrea cucullata]|uniref:uncharacterized protein LOC134260838 n=1 Tax=Saccostrea cuccullata TaxID=36930 RepID=UPI002ED4DEB5
MVVCSEMKMLIVVLLLSFGAQNVAGIYGGCMSYSTTIESSGHLKVKLFFLNGWKIDKGPCRTCTAADKGSDVTQRRKLLIQQTNNQEMFGKWEAEVYSQNGNASYIDKTRIVNNVSTDVVLIVGEKEGWELIGSEISLDFDLTVKEFDITLNSSLDVSMTLLPVIRHINLQVKVEPGIRNDTNRPNRSPIVLVKPLYSHGQLT